MSAPEPSGDTSEAHAPTASGGPQMAEELSPRHLRRRLVELAAIMAALAIVLIVGPGLGGVRSHLAHASPGWIATAVVLEVCSCLSYVVLFRAVFCPQMSLRLSYQIGMAEQAANSLLPVSGAGGLALGAWALHRGGMSAAHIGRRTVAFFFLTSLANVGAVIVFASLYALSVLSRDPNPALTYAFGAAATAATALVLVLPAILARHPPVGEPSRRLASAMRFARDSLGLGIRDAMALLRHAPVRVLAGSLGITAFDMAVLRVAFTAFGSAPPLGVVVLAYLIGMLGGNIPIPGGIGGIDGGLIAVFALYHVPLGAATAAVLVYHLIALWIPALLGSLAFAQLRNVLRREAQPAMVCMPLTEPLQTVQLPSVSA